MSRNNGMPMLGVPLVGGAKEQAIEEMARHQVGVFHQGFGPLVGSLNNMSLRATLTQVAAGFLCSAIEADALVGSGEDRPPFIDEAGELDIMLAAESALDVWEAVGAELSRRAQKEQERLEAEAEAVEQGGAS